MPRWIRVLSCLALLLALSFGAGQAQSLRGRVSLQVQGSTLEQSAAPGFHFDAEYPLVGGLSAVGGAGFSAYILEGRRNGTYLISPEAGLNFTIPTESLGAYSVFGGGGYHLAVGPSDAPGGPTVHLGVGRLRTFQESTVFVNVNATFVVRQETTTFVFPLRTGIIF